MKNRLQFNRLPRIYNDRNGATEALETYIKKGSFIPLIGEPIAVRYYDENNEKQLMLAIGKATGSTSGDVEHREYHIIDTAEIKERIENLSSDVESRFNELSGVVETNLMEIYALIEDNEEVIAAAFNDLNDRVKDNDQDIDRLEQAINAVSAYTNGVLTITYNESECGSYSPSANTAINIDVHGSNVPMTGYETSTGTTPEELAILTGDTVCEAAGKLQKQIIDNEEVTSAALNDLNDRVLDNEATTAEKFNELSGFAEYLRDEVTDCFNNAIYDSSEKTIVFMHDGVTKAEIDATDFIKDGMVDNVEVRTPESGPHAGVKCLIITFNTDSGKEEIEIPVSDIFDPGLLVSLSGSVVYNATNIAGLSSGLTNLSASVLSNVTKISNVSGSVITNKNNISVLSGIIEDNEEVIAAAFNDLNDRVKDLTANAATVSDLANISSQMTDKTKGVLTLSLNGVEKGKYSPSANTSINLQFEDTTYAAGNGIDITNNTVSAKLADKGDTTYLKLDSDGLYLSGLTEAIADASSDVQTLSGDMVSYIEAISGDVVTYVNTISGDVHNTVTKLSGDVVTYVNALSGDVVTYVNNFSGDVHNTITKLSGDVVTYVNALSGDVVTYVNKLSGDVITYANAISGSVVSYVDQLSADTYNTFVAISGVIEDNEEVIAEAFNDLNDRVIYLESNVFDAENYYTKSETYAKTDVYNKEQIMELFAASGGNPDAAISALTESLEVLSGVTTNLSGAAHTKITSLSAAVVSLSSSIPDDSNLVHKTGIEYIDGLKWFNTGIKSQGNIVFDSSESVPIIKTTNSTGFDWIEDDEGDSVQDYFDDLSGLTQDVYQGLNNLSAATTAISQSLTTLSGAAHTKITNLSAATVNLSAATTAISQNLTNFSAAVQSNYYTKQEVDDKIASGGTFDPSQYYNTANTYNRTQIENLISSYTPDVTVSASTSYSAITSTSAKTSVSATTSVSAKTSASAVTSTSARTSLSAVTSTSAKTSVSAVTSQSAITSLSATTALHVLRQFETLSSLADVPLVKYLYLADVDADATVGFTSSLPAMANGEVRESHLIIHNTGSTDVTISFDANDTRLLYTPSADNLVIGAGERGEINVLFTSANEIYIITS